ncbi:histidine phosphatase family protein [Noviherbaspirillum sp.]|uniref:histidine phosphatase family protein n=1 Tax=Noviherbaspirillum sp. TaxID=1926288 RepID=UPI002D57FB1D|nr:histidine phosphatase family protein [Noviherbaspirillum sp.]HZW23616.1 histidine phosphatase family protein [Noviherbaspirillum sp.]
MRLYLVRHARPVVAQGTCYGSTDLAADEDHQREVLPQLLQALPAGARIFSSPMKRCRSLAVELAEGLRCGDVVFDPRLMEMDFGAWEMQAWETIPRAEVDAWAGALSNYRPGGGECLLDVARRVLSFHEELTAEKTEDVVVVAHAGTIRLLLAAVQRMTPEEMVAAAARTPNPIAYGAAIAVDC